MTDVEPETEPFTFSARLMLTYILAGVAFVAADKSLYMLAVSFIAWGVFTIRLLLRFGTRGAWALAGMPLAFYWVFLIYLARSGGANDVVI